jgi:hypothetical protein
MGQNRRMLPFLVQPGLLLVGSLGLASGAGPLERATSEPPELLDQRGRADGLLRHRGRVVVALVADLGALRRIKAWEVELRERIEPGSQEIRFLRVADAPQGRGITRQSVIDKLEGRVPDEVSILIDLDGTWRRAYGLRTHRPNVLLFDRRGRLVRTLRANSEAALADRVVEWIDELRAGDP